MLWLTPRGQVQPKCGGDLRDNEKQLMQTAMETGRALKSGAAMKGEDGMSQLMSHRESTVHVKGKRYTAHTC